MREILKGPDNSLVYGNKITKRPILYKLEID